jgi:cytochrome P450
VPAGGRTIAGVYIPGGTIVANNASGMYIDASIWGADVDAYRPERWLEATEEQRHRMNRANLLFSAGKRMCLGMNVSWLEMKKVIPALIMNFEVSFENPSCDWYKFGINEHDRWRSCIPNRVFIRHPASLVNQVRSGCISRLDINSECTDDVDVAG